jgi:glycosyltransferase involved in cell wall biosynthesis
MKILFISPHLSTGGLPQYLLKKIQTLYKEHDIHLVEYFNVSNDFVVQKKQLRALLGDKLYTLGEDKEVLLAVVENIKPDIVHVEEMPEFFMSLEIATQLFKKEGRNYKILQTTHSSKVIPSEASFYPDEFVLVSKWSQQQFSEQLPHIPNSVWEYPIENFPVDKPSCLQRLGLDPDYKHVLMVGLFTDDKNQGEIFLVAKLLEKFKIKFHFVGNLSNEFKQYCEKILAFKPENCFIWGEREDVSDFYQACDLFYFSSTLELNPLAIKEALSYKLPCLFRRLHTYLDVYDNHPLVTYIDNNIFKTQQLLLDKLQPRLH